MRKCTQTPRPRSVAIANSCSTLAIAGASDLAQRVATRLLAAEALGLRPIGFYDDDVPAGTRRPQGPALAVEGDLAALVKLAREGGVDYVYIASPNPINLSGRFQHQADLDGGAERFRA